jgi:hypothetical protein
MEMSIEEIRYRLQAMQTMCAFQDAVGHELSQNEIKLYNQAKDGAIDIMRKYQKIEQILDDCDLEAWEVLEKIKEVVIKTDEAESER